MKIFIIIVMEFEMQKILVVEDNEMNRDILARRLQRQGFEVVTAENGQEAIEKAKSDQFDLILMDISLPVIDGWEAIRLIKEDSTTNGVPIIALTAHEVVEDLNSGLQAACDDYDTKPIDFKRLMEKIRHYLPAEKI